MTEENTLNATLATGVVPNQDRGIEAIRNLAESAYVAGHKTDDGREFVMMRGENGSQKLEEVTPKGWLPPAPRRARAKRKFYENESLVTYANRFSLDNATLVGDLDENVIRIVIDDHAGDTASWREHIADLKLLLTPEFKMWSSMEAQRNGNKLKLHGQEDFLVFLEERATDIVAPDRASLKEMIRNFQVATEGAVGAKTNLTSGEKTIEFKSEHNAISEVAVPERLTIRIALYQGEPEIDLELLFRYRIVGADIVFGFEWHRLAETMEATFKQAATSVAEGTGLTVLYGDHQIL